MASVTKENYGTGKLVGYEGPIECATCHCVFPHTDFYVRGRRHRRECRFCRTAKSRASYERIETGDARWMLARNRKLERLYGITHEQFVAMARAQGNRCALCGKVPTAVRRSKAKGTIWTGLHVDHDHESGRIRGLLCNHCNVAIGWIERIGPGKATTYLYSGASAPSGSSAPSAATH